jgi:hypothetical protein
LCIREGGGFGVLGQHIRPVVRVRPFANHAGKESRVVGGIVKPVVGNGLVEADGMTGETLFSIGGVSVEILSKDLSVA